MPVVYYDSSERVRVRVISRNYTRTSKSRLVISQLTLISVRSIALYSGLRFDYETSTSVFNVVICNVLE